MGVLYFCEIFILKIQKSWFVEKSVGRHRRLCFYSACLWKKAIEPSSATPQGHPNAICPSKNAILTFYKHKISFYLYFIYRFLSSFYFYIKNEYLIFYDFFKGWAIPILPLYSLLRNSLVISLFLLF